MAITKVINDAVDLNQASDYSGLRLPVGTTGNVVESFTTDYLVVGGGGGGGTAMGASAIGAGAGGGAGGLRTSYNNSTTTTNTLGFPSGKTAIATYMLDNNATDISESYDGAETNITYDTGKYGGGAVFNGSSSSIFISSTGTSVTDYDQDFSISFWFNFISLNANYSYNVLFTGGGTKNIQFLIDTTNGARFQFYNGTIYYVDTGAVSAGNWYHVVATRSKTNGLEIYLNGISKDTNSFTGNSSAINNKDSIGSYWDGTRNSFNGKIDQVRIYDSALSSTDVTNIYTNEVQANSGGGTPAESSLTLTEGVAYDVTVGAGGVKGIYNTSVSTVGNNSVFHTITSDGGGAGGNYNATATVNGGSGGGAAYNGAPGNGTLAQGYGGGSNMQSAYGYGNGGGGGAAAIGGNATTTNSGSGGIGTINSILNSTNASASYIGQVSGSNVYYAGGGGGGVLSGYGTGPGGLGGGGAGGIGVANDGETALNNTGGGGGGAGKTAGGGTPSADGGNGGSGVVILRYPTASVSSFTTTGTLNTPSTTDTLASAAYPVTNTAYYKLDGDATDSSGNGYNGSAPNVTWTNGRFSQAADFSGSVSYINTGYTRSGNEFAFSMWVNASDIGARQYLLADFNSTGSTFSFSIACFIDASNNINIYIGDGTNFQASIATGFSSYYNKWTHIALSIASDGKTATLYLDNNKTIGTAVINAYQTGQNPIGLGHWGGSPSSSNEFTGLMDQVRIYSTALSDSNVTDLYNEHYQTQFTDGSDTAILFTEGTGAVTFNGVNPDAPQGAIRTNTSYSEDGSGSVIEHYNGTEWKYFDAIKYCTTNTLNFPLGAGCIASYNLNNNVDDIGNTYNGLNSSVNFNASGKFGAAAVFNGSSSEITVSSFASLSQVGISMWVNMPDISQQAGLIARYGSYREFAIYMYGGTLIASIYYNGNNGNATSVTTSTYMSNDTWHHIAYTADGVNQPRLYIDGAEVGTAQSNNNTYYTSSEALDIGHFAGVAAYNYEGKIDQVRIFNSAISSDQVGELYNKEIACS